MEDYEIIKNIIHNIESESEIRFESEEEYYFTLGQTLTAVFIELGGVNKYRSEFNYLTNPYLPMPVHNLARRILGFLEKYKNKTTFSNPQLTMVVDALLTSSEKFVHTKVNTKEAEMAFYSGLYRDSFLKD